MQQPLAAALLEAPCDLNPQCLQCLLELDVFLSVDLARSRTFLIKPQRIISTCPHVLLVHQAYVMPPHKFDGQDGTSNGSKPSPGLTHRIRIERRIRARDGGRKRSLQHGLYCVLHRLGMGVPRSLN